MNELWPFKYEPTELSEMVLSEENRNVLENVIKEVPNIILYGPSGIGKGTFVNVFLKKTGLDFIKINASDETSIDNIRMKVKQFATSMGNTPLKIVYLNECDYLSPAAQGMLRQLMEDVHKITRFFLVCNFEHKVIEPIKSRCQLISMSNPPAKEIYKLCENILKKENIEFNTKTIVSLIKSAYPDVRRIINALQKNVSNGKLAEAITLETSDKFFEIVIDLMKKSDLEELRKNLRSNAFDYNMLYKYLFDNVGNFASPGEVIIEIGEAAYRNEIVANKEINFMSHVVKLLKNKSI